MAGKKQSFEDAMKRLSEIVETLEAGEETLEASMKLFEEGAKLSAECYQALEQAEQKITELQDVEGQDDDGSKL